MVRIKQGWMMVCLMSVLCVSQGYAAVSQSQGSSSLSVAKEIKKDSAASSEKATSSGTKATPVVKAAAAAATTSTVDGNLQNVVKTMSIDEKSGTPVVTIPLSVPEGRGGVSPTMAISYSPLSGNGPFGWGWNMDLGEVVRSTKNGFPNYLSTDNFNATIFGKTVELAEVSYGEYRAKVDDDRTKFLFKNGYWQAKDRSGRIYSFGSRTGSQVLNGTNVFKWRLDRVEDVFGNVMVVDYKADGSFEIRYSLMAGKNAVTDVNHPNNFAYRVSSTMVGGLRADATTDYKPGFDVGEKRLVRSLDVMAGGALLRRYTFDYQTSGRTGRYFLRSVTEVASDGTSSRLVISLRYADSVPSYTTSALVGPYPQFMGDFDGDGRTDIGVFSASSGTFQVALSNGNGFSSLTTWISGFGNNKSIVLGDWNGDGRMDIGHADHSTGSFSCAFSNGTKFINYGALIQKQIHRLAYVITGSNSFNGQAHLISVLPGDYMDQLCFFYFNGTNSISGRMKYWSHVFKAGYNFMMGDMNGDGVADLLEYNKTTGDWRVYVYINGFSKTPTYTMSGFSVNKTPILADLDQNGSTDIGYYDAAAKKIIYRPSTSTGFGSEKNITLTTSLTASLVQVVDVNGDGNNDYIACNSSGACEQILSKGNMPDILRSYDNGHGGRVDMDYGVSTDYSNRYLPFSLPVVKSVSLSNGWGDVYKTDYSYTGGYWDPLQREYYGFSEVRSSDASGVSVKTIFFQDLIFLRGKMQSRAVYSKGGSILSEERYQWNNDSVISGNANIRFVSLRRMDSFIYDTVSTGIRTAKEFTYDIASGMPSKIVDFGEVDFQTGADVKEDALQTLVTYVSSSSKWLYGFPSSKQVVDMQGAKLSEERFYYDGATSFTNGPVKGLLTRKDVWNKVGTSESFISIYNEYSAYGLLTTTKKAGGGFTSVGYDPVWAMFPMMSKRGLEMSTSYEYYGINGVSVSGGMWGAAKAVVDVNGARSVKTYDLWGRVSREVGPLDSLEFPTLVYEYKQGAGYDLTITKSRMEHGKPETMDAYFFVDGLGRGICVKSPSETAGVYLVSGHASWNARGLVEEEYPPYFSTRPVEGVELPDKARAGVVYEYDDLGREVKVASPDGSFRSAAYMSSSLATTDANGHRRVAVNNARGQVIRVEEYSGADGRSSVYPQEAFALYASTSYEYDPRGSLKRVVDADGRETKMSYDALGQKREMVSPDMGLMKYEYDGLGQLTSQVDSKGQRSVLSYDLLGRLLNRGQSDGKQVVSYKYDLSLPYSKGRLGAVSYGSGMTAFQYDALGQEVLSKKVIDGKEYTVARAYDALGRIKELSYPDGTAKVRYSYNAAGGMERVELQTGASIREIIRNLDYNPAGSVSRIVYGNGLTAAYDYDPLSWRLKSKIVTDSQGSVLDSKSYEYDPEGNVLKVVDRVKNQTNSYAYDHLSRMVTSNDGTGPVSYVYDKTGNLIKKGFLVYTYGEMGAGPHAVTSLSDGSRMSYDGNGNMTLLQTADKNTFYTYDADNRLVLVEDQKKGAPLREKIAEYLYDGDGGRTAKKTSSGSTYYVGFLYEEVEGRGLGHIFLGGERVAQVDGSRISWILSDHLGSASLVTDDLGKVVQKMQYGPWGEIKSIEHYANTPQTAWFYFTGKKLDDEVGLYYFGARYYNPKLGRFLTPDTIVQTPLNPQTLNRYTYCNNNPVSLVDPTGHSWKKFFKAAAIAIVGVALSIVTGGAATAAFGAYWGGVVSGAVIGATAGGATAAAMGGSIGQGMLIGALGGAVFAGVAPAFNAVGQTAARGMSIGSGASGPLSAGWSMGANAGANFFAGAVSGAVVAGVVGANVGEAALIGGAIAGGWSVLRDTASLMRSDMVEQSRLDPRNASGKSAGAEGDGFKAAGARFDPRHPNAGPAPLGGIQGGQGKIFGFNYPPGGVVDFVFERYAGPHDSLNGWTYDSMGNLRNLNFAERVVNTFTNPLNVGLATPLAVPYMTPQAAYSAPTIVYGEYCGND